MNIRGIIWSTTQEKAERMLRDMEYRYNNMCGYRTTSNMRDQCNFENGDVWRAMAANDKMTHGARCHIAYVDSAINLEIVKKCIIPCCSLPPFNAVHYFNYDIETFEGDE